MNQRLKYLVAFMLILIAAFSRLIPHPLNFTPVAAIALFGGVYFDKKFAIIVPISALIISDYFLGFYSEIFWVYGSFAIVGFLGMWLKNHKSVPMIAGTTLLGSILFFIITNFGVWVSAHDTYAMNLNGLIACYVAAIPFFRNSLAGDLFYVGVLFGVYEFAQKYFYQRNFVKA